MTSSETSRREFLIGRSAVRALEALGEAAGDRPSEPAADQPASYLLEVTRRAMACEFQVLLDAVRFPHGTEPAIEALDVVEQLEEQLTIFRATSQISQLNSEAADRPVRLDVRLYELLKQCVAYYELTGGAFDITAGPLTRIWGFMRRQGRMPSSAEVAAALDKVGSRYLQFNDAERTLAFTRVGMEINLGAIGKGYALDRCAERLLASGIGDFLLHGGNSSILAMGNFAGRRGWTVGLRDPIRPERRIAEIQLQDQALGTSGTANQYFYYQGRRYGHLLDPRTGKPAEDLLAATVLAPSAAEADAMSTALFVMGREAALAFCESHPHLSAILIGPGERAGDLRLTTIHLPDERWRLVEGTE